MGNSDFHMCWRKMTGGVSRYTIAAVWCHLNCHGCILPNPGTYTLVRSWDFSAAVQRCRVKQLRKAFSIPDQTTPGCFLAHSAIASRMIMQPLLLPLEVCSLFEGWVEGLKEAKQETNPTCSQIYSHLFWILSASPADLLPCFAHDWVSFIS